jgi:hypothetical protein
VFGIFGAAIAAAKIQGLDADQVNGAIAQRVNLAAGNLEGARSGGRSLREGGAVRNALLAVASRSPLLGEGRVDRHHDRRTDVPIPQPTLKRDDHLEDCWEVP